MTHLSINITGNEFIIRCAHDDCSWKIENDDILVDDPDNEFLSERMESHVEADGHTMFEGTATMMIEGAMETTEAQVPFEFEVDDD